MEMSIHRALSELKLLDAKIQKGLRNQFIGSKKKSDEKVSQTGSITSMFEAKALSEYQSLQDLIRRRAMIKSKIVESNAKTQVTIAGERYTVAEAIEHKNTVAYLESLLRELKSQYNSVVSYVNNYNSTTEYEINSEIDRMNQSKANPLQGDQLSAYVELQHAMRDMEVVDPLHLSGEIDKLETYIMDFKNEVDYILSTSNAVTLITVD